MDVVSQGPLRVASFLWAPRAGQWTLTVICKATFELQPGACALAAEQDLVNEEDNHWDDDPTRSLYSPADLVPYKPRADVLLVGSAFAPGGHPVPSLVARLSVGAIRKAIEVHGDRSTGPDGQARDAAPFVKMPIRYERAAGGPDTWNPVGVRLDGVPDAHGGLALPNLQPLGSSLVRRGDFVAPVGFGPLAPSWPERRSRLGKLAGAWPAPGWADRPFPEGFDPGYFNAAPRDQQLDVLPGGERLVLENLHPEHPHLAMTLPSAAPAAVVERPGAPAAELPMVADTLWIDTDRGVCTVVWRAHVNLADRTEWGRVTVVAGAPNDPRNPHDTMDLGHVTAAIRLPRPAAPAPATSTGDVEEVSIDEEVSVAPDDDGGAAVQTMLLGLRPVPARAALPFATPDPPAPPAPPAVRVPSTDMIPPAPTPASPWAAPREAVVVPPPRASGGGVLEASNAAAGAVVAAPRPEPREAPPPEPRPRALPREVIKLLWFDPRSVGRIRKQADWRVLLAELELRLLDEGDFDEDEAADKDRRDVFEVLLKGKPIGHDGVKAALTAAIDDDGRFEPPLVLLAGELELPFDELATLRATAAAAAPFALGDKKLKEQLDVVEELLKTPWLQGSGSIAEGLTEKLKEAFGQAKRGVGPEYLASHTDRMLLEQRCYQTRTVFGKRWIRSLLGGSGAPVYVPEALKDELPMYRKVKVKLIGEVDLQEDQFETGGAAVKVVALGRVMG